MKDSMPKATFRCYVLICCTLTLAPLPSTTLAADRVRVAQVEMDEAAWSLIRDAADPSVFDRFLEQYPDSPRAAEARSKLEVLMEAGEELPAPEGPRGADATVERPQASAPSLAAEVQTELKRVGCYSGPVDGDWGRGSRSALAAFASATGSSLGTQPTADALSTIRGKRDRVCTTTRNPRPSQMPQRERSLVGTWAYLRTCGDRTLAGQVKIDSADTRGISGRGPDARISGGSVDGNSVTMAVTLGGQSRELWTLSIQTPDRLGGLVKGKPACIVGMGRILSY